MEVFLSYFMNKQKQISVENTEFFYMVSLYGIFRLLTISMSKHILFVLDYFSPHKWGAETVFDNITKRLVAQWYRITVLTSHFDKKLKKYEKQHKIDIYRSGKNRIAFLWKWFWTGRKIIKNFQQQWEAIDLIHTSTYWWALPAWALGKLFHKKTLLTVHEVFGKLRYVYKWKFRGFLFLCFEKLIFSVHYNYYHSVSRYTMNALRLMYGISDAKIRTIYNWIDTDFWDIDKVDKKNIAQLRDKYQRNKDFVVLYYGHSGKSKWLDFLIQALPEIINNHNDLHLVFNLIPAERDQICKTEIQKQVGKLEKHKQSKVHVFSWMPLKELRDLVASCNVVIAPSLAEGFGSVHTEATAMWKTLITTDIWPLPEVLSGKVIFIRPQDSQAIVKAIDTARNWNITKIPEKHFSWDVCVKEVEEVYRIT